MRRTSSPLAQFPRFFFRGAPLFTSPSLDLSRCLFRAPLVSSTSLGLPLLFSSDCIKYLRWNSLLFHLLRTRLFDLPGIKLLILLQSLPCFFCKSISKVSSLSLQGPCLTSGFRPPCHLS